MQSCRKDRALRFHDKRPRTAQEEPEVLYHSELLKALGVEFYAFVPADGFSSGIGQEKLGFILVQITREELMQIRKSA